MTELEKAQLASELLNGLVPLFTGSFLLGLLVGVFFFGRLAQFIDRLGSRFRRPSRIKHASDGKQDQYLYLFRGKYYSFDEVKHLMNLARQKIKQANNYEN